MPVPFGFLRSAENANLLQLLHTLRRIVRIARQELLHFTPIAQIQPMILFLRYREFMIFLHIFLQQPVHLIPASRLRSMFRQTKCLQLVHTFLHIAAGMNFTPLLRTPRTQVKAFIILIALWQTSTLRHKPLQRLIMLLPYHIACSTEQANLTQFIHSFLGIIRQLGMQFLIAAPFAKSEIFIIFCLNRETAILRHILLQ